MKENDGLLENEKCFDFPKMDKKNVQNEKARIFYGKSIVCDDKLILWSRRLKNIF
jgi:hypothetical protein